MPARRYWRSMRLPGALCALYLHACAVNPVTGTPDFVLMSEEQEISLGRQYSTEIVKEMPVYDNPALTELVQPVGDRIAANSHRPDLVYRFTVLDSTPTMTRACRKSSRRQAGSTRPAAAAGTVSCTASRAWSSAAVKPMASSVAIASITASWISQSPSRPAGASNTRTIASSWQAATITAWCNSRSPTSTSASRRRSS